MEERLDQLTLDLELLEVSSHIVHDVERHLRESLRVFTENWDLVHGILDSVEEMRRQFIGDFLDGSDPASSIPSGMKALSSGFSDYIARLNLYQRGQKAMVRDSALIVTGVKNLRSLFDTIKPIIARLQHVRITQQIEVAKNPAISAVKDTVDHMSDLIMQADGRVRDTRKDLEEFINSIEELTGSFTVSSEHAQRELERIKQDKVQFFNRMNEHQEELTSQMYGLKIYPDSFAETCRKIDTVLDSLGQTVAGMSGLATHFTETIESYRAERQRLLAQAGETEWSIHNDHLRSLAERFTITTHKQAAGNIGGFEVEKQSLDAIESGDVTLFF